MPFARTRHASAATASSIACRCSRAPCAPLPEPRAAAARRAAPSRARHRRWPSITCRAAPLRPSPQRRRSPRSPLARRYRCRHSCAARSAAIARRCAVAFALPPLRAARASCLALVRPLRCSAARRAAQAPPVPRTLAVTSLPGLAALRSLSAAPAPLPLSSSSSYKYPTPLYFPHSISSLPPLHASLVPACRGQAACAGKRLPRSAIAG